MTTYSELVESYSAEDGYPSEDWIKRFDALDTMTLQPKEAAAFLVSDLPQIAETISCMSIRMSEGRGRYSEDRLKRIEFHTGGWSGAEDLISSMLGQFWIRHFHTKWERGGHFYFEVPVNLLVGVTA